jgi:hypothetical protein
VLKVLVRVRTLKVQDRNLLSEDIELLVADVLEIGIHQTKEQAVRVVVRRLMELVRRVTLADMTQLKDMLEEALQITTRLQVEAGAQVE